MRSQGSRTDNQAITSTGRGEKSSLVLGWLCNAAGCWPSKLARDGGRIHPGHQVERNKDSDTSKAQTRAMAVFSRFAQLTMQGNCVFHIRSLLQKKKKILA